MSKSHFPRERRTLNDRGGKYSREHSFCVSRGCVRLLYLLYLLCLLCLPAILVSGRKQKSALRVRGKGSRLEKPAGAKKSTAKDAAPRIGIGEKVEHVSPVPRRRNATTRLYLFLAGFILLQPRRPREQQLDQMKLLMHRAGVGGKGTDNRVPPSSSSSSSPSA